MKHVLMYAMLIGMRGSTDLARGTLLISVINTQWRPDKSSKLATWTKRCSRDSKPAQDFSDATLDVAPSFFLVPAIVHQLFCKDTATIKLHET